MNTTAPRARAGKPYVPPFPTRRVMPEQVTASNEGDGYAVHIDRSGNVTDMKPEAPLPIDFVLPDEYDQAVRDGFDAAMKAPISKPIVPQPLRDSERIEPEGPAWFGYLLIACLLCVIFSGLGYLAGRYLS